MSDIGQMRKALIAGALEGSGVAGRILRRAAFDNLGLSKPTSTLIGKVVHHASMVLDEDIVAVRASGLSEDEIFELVVCAAIGQAARQYNVALRALDTALAAPDTISGKR